MGAKLPPEETRQEGAGCGTLGGVWSWISIGVTDSARKRGATDQDIQAAVFNALAVEVIEEDPDKVLCIGFDTAGRLLEVVMIVGRDNTALAIHAMACRKTYRERYLNR